MAITATVKKKTYSGTDTFHAEQVMFRTGLYETGNLNVELTGWPCEGEHRHDCHKLFKTKSKGRIITVEITGDSGGYAANHPGRVGAASNQKTGTITYNNGTPTYS
jgi:hypothetical protein